VEYQKLKNNDATLTITCVKITNDPFYIGLAHVMKVAAPLSQVASVLDRFEDYQKLFPGFTEVSTSNMDKHTALIHWSQVTPFFLPKIIYDTVITFETLPSGLRYYRQQLKAPSVTLLSVDSLCVLELISNNETLYTEFDYFKTDAGIVKNIISPESVWLPSIEGAIVSDFVVKLKSENPQWSFSTINKTAKEMAKHYPLQRIYQARREIDF
jgi:hypothetical protein